MTKIHVWHSLAIILALGATMPAVAGDDIKTLPAPIYSQLKSGKKLDKVLISPDYDKAKGFKVGPVNYKAEFRSTEAMEALPRALASLAKAGSPMTLQLAVIEVKTRHFMGFDYMPGTVTVEGQIVDPDGKVLVAFKTKGKAGSFGDIKDDFGLAADRISTAIAADLQ